MSKHDFTYPWLKLLSSTLQDSRPPSNFLDSKTKISIFLNECEMEMLYNQ